AYLFSDLGRVRKEWKHAWELRTTHYRLATNLDLASACDLALELELYYRAFYARFGKALGLRDVTDPMPCEVHPDQAPHPATGDRMAYFDAVPRTVYELALGGLVLDALLHEATHQLLYCTAVEPRKATGVIPAWLDEGLAEYMSSTRTGTPAHPVYRDDARI